MPFIEKFLSRSIIKLEYIVIVIIIYYYYQNVDNSIYSNLYYL